MTLVGAILGAGIGIIMGILVVVVFLQIKGSKEETASEAHKKYLIRLLVGLPSLWVGGFIGNTVIGGYILNNLEEIIPVYLGYSLGVFTLIIIYPLVCFIIYTANLYKISGRDQK